ncbi:MAG: hypothetical protein C4581_14120 [Nitrospiraceae bacterium]|nr:MAG: hypothetical protein C4581_14120 [Nitrospiraceae bacterium]
MHLTSYHAKYFAYELTHRYSSDSLQKLAASLSDAQVDLNSQIETNELFTIKWRVIKKGGGHERELVGCI